MKLTDLYKFDCSEYYVSCYTALWGLTYQTVKIYGCIDCVIVRIIGIYPLRVIPSTRKFALTTNNDVHLNDILVRISGQARKLVRISGANANSTDEKLVKTSVSLVPGKLLNNFCRQWQHWLSRQHLWLWSVNFLPDLEIHIHISATMSIVPSAISISDYQVPNFDNSEHAYCRAPSTSEFSSLIAFWVDLLPCVLILFRGLVDTGLLGLEFRCDNTTQRVITGILDSDLLLLVGSTIMMLPGCTRHDEKRTWHLSSHP